jgi:hypothetical protein
MPDWAHIIELEKAVFLTLFLEKRQILALLYKESTIYWDHQLLQTHTPPSNQPQKTTG